MSFTEPSVIVKIEPITEEYEHATGACGLQAEADAVPQPEFVSIKIEPEDLTDSSDGVSALVHATASTNGCSRLQPAVPLYVTVKQEHLEPEVISTEGKEFTRMEDDNLITLMNRNSEYSERWITDDFIASLIKSDKCKCFCGKQLSSKSNLQRHLLTHQHIKQQCHMCPRQFLNRLLLEKHIQNVHGDDKVYECDDCGKHYRSSSNLFQHRRVHLTVKPFSCEICHKTFAVKCNLLKHQGKSRCKTPRTQPLICTICNKLFKREYLLKSHLNVHNDEKPFECADCGMKFKYKSTLIRHFQLHNNDRPHACKECGKTFTHPGLIKPHMRMHTGERPYTCPICQKRFSHKHNMQRHMLRHNKIKHLVCEVCHRQFPKESRLKYHMRMHMEDKKPFKCEFCKKSYSHRQNIQRHYKKKHPTQSYNRPETDASVASVFWEAVLKKKMEAEKDFIIPELTYPDEVVKIKEEKEE